MLSISRAHHRFPEKQILSISYACWLATLAVLVLLALHVRLPLQMQNLGDLLWAEDGSIFLAEVYERGASSLITPYAGYLHLYPRLVALIVPSLGLQSVPYIFAAAWLAIVACFVYVLVTRVLALGIAPWQALVVVALILLQPHSGEIFFSVTNAQWFLGASLALIVCVDNLGATGKPKYLLLLLMSLTGPFVILVWPAVLLRAIFDKEIRQAYSAIAILLLCALIQLWFLMTSGRVAGELNADLYAWVQALCRALSFHTYKQGPHARLAMFAAVAFWGIVLIAIIKELRGGAFPIAQRLPLAAILLSVVTFYFAGLWSSKADPLALSPVGAGARYFFIPYCLGLVVVFQLLSRETILFVLGGLFFAVVCHIKFQPVERGAVNFPAFAEFSKIKPEVFIPLNPVWPVYPGWGILTSSRRDEPGHPLALQAVHGNMERAEQYVDISSQDSDPQIIFKQVHHCGDAKYLGVRLEVERDEDGWAKVFWSGSDKSFDLRHSFRRFYPAGKVRMDFAFPNIPEGVVIRFDPVTGTKKSRLYNAEVFCLKS